MFSNRGSHFHGLAVDDLAGSFEFPVKGCQSLQVLRGECALVKKRREHLVGGVVVAAQAGDPGPTQVEKCGTNVANSRAWQPVISGKRFQGIGKGHHPFQVVSLG